MDMHMRRIEKLQNLLAERNMDAALITSGENIRYFSGFTSDESALLVTKGKAALFTDFRYLIQARE
ncbi:MAG: aminopeptidase P family N-terminal domain-containing protein, partial [Clostridia bacterium]|nr:aminopeptidase P family N-terminal domain-containing protein [Clostridia bacterium]